METDSHSDEGRTSVWNVMGEEFELDTKYKVTDYLGAGAYGVVCSVNDSNDGKSYAIKKCKKIFHSRTLARRTLREIRFLRLMKHDNIIKIREIMLPKNETTFDSLYIVFELMESDLAQIIRSPQKLSDQHVQYFTYQIMASLKYLHEAGIVHRDLKPRNILVNGNCLLKVADFGLARLYNESNDTKIIAMTEYVTTRWYRAPEILVGWSNYSSAIDMWAVGCIIGELIGRAPMFPGSDSLKQIQLICHYLGQPQSNFIDNCRKPFYKQYLRDSQNRPMDLRDIYPNANYQAIELMCTLLRYDPNMRLTASDGMNHSYLTPMRPFFTKSQSQSFDSIDQEFEFEQRRLTIDELRFEVKREVLMCQLITKEREASANRPKPQKPQLRTATQQLRSSDVSPGRRPDDYKYFDPSSLKEQALPASGRRSARIGFEAEEEAEVKREEDMTAKPKEYPSNRNTYGCMDASEDEPASPSPATKSKQKFCTQM